MDNHLRWLERELPGWVTAGYITQAGAEALQAKYGVEAKQRGWGSIVWTVLAAALIAFGLLLLLSEQWYSLLRDTRFYSVLGLVVIVQAAAAAVGYLQPERSLWREAVGVLYGIILPGALYLIGDMYRLDDFVGWKWVLWSALFLLPAAYWLRSVCLASMYALLAACFVAADGNENAWFGTQLVWFLLAAIAPYFYVLYRERLPEKSLLLFGWCYGLALYFALFIGLQGIHALPLTFTAILSVFTFLLGHTLTKGKIWGIPFRWIGAFGLVGTLLAGTDRSIWAAMRADTLQLLPVVVLVLLLFIVGGVTWRLWLRREYVATAVSVLPFAFAVATLLACFGIGYTFHALFFMAVYLAGTGYVLHRGIRLRSLWWTDTGLLMAAAFIIVRLLDTAFSPWERGLAFLVLGIAIVAVDWSVRFRAKPARRRGVQRRRAAEREAEKREKGISPAVAERPQAYAAAPTSRRTAEKNVATPGAEAAGRERPTLPQAPPPPVWRQPGVERDSAGKGAERHDS